MAVNINSLMAESERAAASMLDFRVSAAQQVAEQDSEARKKIQQLTLADALLKTKESIELMNKRVQVLRDNGIVPAGTGGNK